MAQEVLLYLSLILSIAAILTVVARFIRQPPLIAYLVAGILVGPLFLQFIGPASESSVVIQIFAHIGVAFLLFIVGLSLDFHLLKEVGGVATVAGLAQIVAVGTIGFFIALGLGSTTITAIYIGAVLAFSSTVVVVKILSDKKEIDTLHGRIALGILIVQDFVAAIALMIVPLLNNAGNFGGIVQKFLLVIATIVVIFLVALYALPRLLDYLARNQEALFLFGIAWALSLATLFDSLGFSLEIGALIAGMSLASSKYNLELGGKMKPLRDFFVVLFFVFFGSQLAGPITSDILTKAVIFSAFVLIGKPLIVMISLKIFGYKKRTNFLASLSLAQISEFSLILTLLGFSLGHISQEIMSLAILISLITIGINSYTLYYNHAIFTRVAHLLNFFEGNKEKNLKIGEIPAEVIVFGYHRMGYQIVEELKKQNRKFLVVDYNPKVIIDLAKKKIEGIYGDAGDKEFLSELDLAKAKVIISTIPDQGTNISIAETLAEIKSTATFIATAEQPRAALELYELGADYVLIPHHLGGYYASHMISSYKTEKSKYRKLGKEHRNKLNRGKKSSTYT